MTAGAPLALPEGAEVEVTLTPDPPASPEPDPTTATAGAWRCLLDTERFEADTYDDRSDLYGAVLRI